MSIMDGHTSSLSYTNMDDGIWLECTMADTSSGAEAQTHFAKNLGYFPSVEEVIKAWNEHVEEVRAESRNERAEEEPFQFQDDGSNAPGADFGSWISSLRAEDTARNS